jgi:hypothetical protein
MKTLMPAQLSWENKAHQLLVFHKRSSVYTRKNCIGFQVLILMYTYCIMCQSLWLSTSMNPLRKMIGQPFLLLALLVKRDYRTMQSFFSTTF